jgi:hypothetical protein
VVTLQTKSYEDDIWVKLARIVPGVEFCLWFCMGVKLGLSH